MNLEEASLDATTFTKNRDRLLKHQIAAKFFRIVVEHARTEKILSQEHFTVHGTLIEAWASMKSFRPKYEDPSERPTMDDDKDNPTVNFQGEQRKNETHKSTTDLEAILMRKGAGKEAKLSYVAHVLMENRYGLLADLKVTPVTGTAERQAVIEMLRKYKPKTVGEDKGYDTEGFVSILRQQQITPRVAANDTRKGGSAIDGRTTRHEGYRISQRIRKKVE